MTFLAQVGYRKYSYYCHPDKANGPIFTRSAFRWDRPCFLVGSARRHAHLSALNLAVPHDDTPGQY